MLVIDGNMGEGGGQVLRTALALSLCRQIPFAMFNIRTRRPKPGLQPQHLAAVHAAAQISGARVTGAAIASQILQFEPAKLTAGDYRFDIGTAGSAILLLQTILPALLLADAGSTLEISGGTHNPMSPSYDFFEQAFCPLLKRMGAVIETRLIRPGFYPRGGGILQVRIAGKHRLQALELLHRGRLVQLRAEILLAHLPDHIAQRERKVLGENLSLDEQAIHIQHKNAALGPGNVISIYAQSEHLTEVFTGFGQRGVRAERVAVDVAKEVNAYLQADVPIGQFLADQLLLPLALAGGGAFVTQAPSLHTTTNIDVIAQFTGQRFHCDEVHKQRWCIALGD